MSSRTLNTCERCKIEKPAEEMPLFDVAIGVQEYDYRYGSSRTYFLNDNLYRKAQWCADCCHVVGIKIDRTKVEKPTVETAPTLEDIIRGWIGEEVAARVGG